MGTGHIHEWTASALASTRCGTTFERRTLNEPKYRQHIDEIIYLMDVPDIDLTRFDAVILPDRMHADRLMLCK
jgi:hypothetical protein